MYMYIEHIDIQEFKSNIKTTSIQLQMV